MAKARKQARRSKEGSKEGEVPRDADAKFSKTSRPRSKQARKQGRQALPAASSVASPAGAPRRVRGEPRRRAGPAPRRHPFSAARAVLSNFASRFLFILFSCVRHSQGDTWERKCYEGAVAWVVFGRVPAGATGSYCFSLPWQPPIFPRYVWQEVHGVSGGARPAGPGCQKPETARAGTTWDSGRARLAVSLAAPQRREREV